jgi:hypothetical protein
MRGCRRRLCSSRARAIAASILHTTSVMRNYGRLCRSATPTRHDRDFDNGGSRVVPLTGAAGLRTLGGRSRRLSLHARRPPLVESLLASTLDDNVERLVRAGKARGVGRAAAQALLLCRNSALISFADGHADKKVTVRWLEATALNAMTAARGEQDPHEVRFERPAAASRPFFSAPVGAYRKRLRKRSRAGFQAPARSPCADDLPMINREQRGSNHKPRVNPRVLQSFGQRRQAHRPLACQPG